MRRRLLRAVEVVLWLAGLGALGAWAYTRDGTTYEPIGAIASFLLAWFTHRKARWDASPPEAVSVSISEAARGNIPPAAPAPETQPIPALSRGEVFTPSEEIQFGVLVREVGSWAERLQKEGLPLKSNWHIALRAEGRFDSVERERIDEWIQESFNIAERAWQYQHGLSKSLTGSKRRAAIIELRAHRFELERIDADFERSRRRVEERLKQSGTPRL